MKKNLKILKNSPLFKNLRENEIMEILTICGSYTKLYKKENYIYHKGDNINHIGIILNGKANIVKEDYWGNRNIVATLKQHSLFAEIFIFLKNEPLNISVVASTDAKVLFIDISKLIENSKTHFINTFIENLIIIISKKTLILNRKIEHLSKRTIKEKVMSFLSEQSEINNSKTFKIPFSRQEMADYLAVDRSALSRELSNIKNEGLIEYNKNNFTLK